MAATGYMGVAMWEGKIGRGFWMLVGGIWLAES